MKLLQGSIHIFTEQPDLAAKAICRELKNQEAYDLNYEHNPESTIIQYPHAVSYFCHLSLSYDYIAKMYSKRRRAPVLVSIVGRMTGPGSMESQALRLFWGLEGKCISSIETISDGDSITARDEGLDVLKSKLDYLIPNNSVLFSSLGNDRPMNISLKLSNELGVFLGNTTLNEYLKGLILKEQFKYGKLYIYSN